MPIAFLFAHDNLHTMGCGQSSFIEPYWPVVSRMSITSQYFLGKRLARCVGRGKTVPQVVKKPQ